MPSGAASDEWLLNHAEFFARLASDMTEPSDMDALSEGVVTLVAAALTVKVGAITDEELGAAVG